MSHYYSKKPKVASSRTLVELKLVGVLVRYVTDRGVFSREKVDRGSLLLIKSVDASNAQVLLDVGCGYGAIGIALAKLYPRLRVVMTDINRRAVQLARENIKLNSLGNAEVRLGNLYEPVKDEKFDIIVSNPPIRAGWRVVFPIIDEAPAHLNHGGCLYIVAKTKQGAPTLEKRMREVFGNCAIIARRGGYRVLRSVLS
ncbi:MAG: 16S rRNA methyltransferase [Thermoproteota archaeon]|nr:MAG: 16S rRNA methyltransferase [Candidatus Korarchaeota archaeon]